MGTKYSTQTVSGYNTSPPSDDGSVSAANKVTWATIKTKLPDPILTLAQGINTQLVTALDAAPTLQTTAYTTVAGDNGKPILVTGTTTISLGSATTMTAGYATTVANIGSNVVTVNLASATDTLDGTVNGTITVPVNGSMTFSVNSAANGYVTTSCGHALNISTITASGLGTFNAGIAIPTGQNITGAGTATVTGFASLSATVMNSISGSVSVGSGVSATIFTPATKQAHLIYITQSTESYGCFGLSYVPDGGTSAVINNIKNDNANLVLTSSGLNVQAFNGTAGTRTVSYFAIRIA